MGIRGTVRRSVDGDFIHSNIDIDLLIDEEQEVGNDQKPKELFDIVERFCLGKRRLVSVSYFSKFRSLLKKKSNVLFIQKILQKPIIALIWTRFEHTARLVDCRTKRDQFKLFSFWLVHFEDLEKLPENFSLPFSLQRWPLDESVG